MKWDATSIFLDSMGSIFLESAPEMVRLVLMEASSWLRNISGERLRVFISSILRSTYFGVALLDREGGGVYMI